MTTGQEDTYRCGPARPVVCPVIARDRATLDRAGRHRYGPLLDQRSRSAPGRATALGAPNQYRSDEGVREILETADVITLAQVSGAVR